MIPAVGLFTQEAFADMARRIVVALPQIITGLIVFAVFWLVAVLLGRVVQRLCEGRELETDLATFLGKSAKVTLILFGLVTALGTMGVDVAALVAGLGLTGFALGFALKDIVSNVLAGVLIMLYKPFVRGDAIVVRSFKGTVVRIDLRYTVLDRGGEAVFVPNSILFTDPVTVERPAGVRPKPETPRPSART